MRRLRRISVFLLVVAVSFVWGYLASRENVFPGGLIRGLYAAWFRPELKTRTDVRAPRQDSDFLVSVPYLSGTLDPDSGNERVILNVKGKVAPGLVFYNSAHEPGAWLLDLDGRVVHSWRYGSTKWQNSAPLPDGGVLGVVQDERLLRLDRDSNLVWEYKARVHHGIFVRKDGRIWVLSRKVVNDPALHPTLPSLEDYVTVLSPEGRLETEFSLIGVLRDSGLGYLLPAPVLREFPAEEGEELVLDILHANHVEVFDGSLADRSPLFAEGNLLVSLRNINTIAILDGSTRKVVWTWGPSNLILQHYPRLLGNGHILVFNNRSEDQGSQVIELDPLTNRIVWQHAGFFSKTRGAAERLPNGNTLIAESDRGYVHEITPEGKAVWRFANPDISEEGVRRPIFRMLRIPVGELPFGK